MSTHDYKTRKVKVTDLNDTTVLVGECGGLSAVLGVPYRAVSISYFCRWVETEHGPLVRHEEDMLDVLDLDEMAGPQ